MTVRFWELLKGMSDREIAEASRFPKIAAITTMRKALAHMTPEHALRFYPGLPLAMVLDLLAATRQPAGEMREAWDDPGPERETLLALLRLIYSRAPVDDPGAMARLEASLRGLL